MVIQWVWTCPRNAGFSVSLVFLFFCVTERDFSRVLSPLFSTYLSISVDWPKWLSHSFWLTVRAHGTDEQVTKHLTKKKQNPKRRRHLLILPVHCHHGQQRVLGMWNSPCLPGFGRSRPWTSRNLVSLSTLGRQVDSGPEPSNFPKALVGLRSNRAGICSSMSQSSPNSSPRSVETSMKIFCLFGDFFFPPEYVPNVNLCKNMSKVLYSELFILPVLGRHCNYYVLRTSMEEERKAEKLTSFHRWEAGTWK